MKNDINPAQLQRKKEKAQQIKKIKASRQKQRFERLSKRNPARLNKQIQQLQSRGEDQLTSTELQRLESLKSEYDEIVNARQKLGLLIETEKRDRQEYRNVERKEIHKEPWRPEKPPGRKSIYWDPVLNPKGYPPLGYPFVDNNRNEDDDSDYDSDSSISKIPLPEGSLEEALRRNQGEKGGQPRSLSSTNTTKTVYESAPVLRDLAKESTTMVPTILKRRKIGSSASPGPTTSSPSKTNAETGSRQPYLEDVEEVSYVDEPSNGNGSDLEEDLEFDYASEEEEYQRNQDLEPSI